MSDLAAAARIRPVVALPVVVGLYLFVVIIPIGFSISIGPLLITPTRLFLALAAVPVLAAAFMRQRLQSEDLLFIAFVLWVVIAYFYKRGAAGIEVAGQAFLEMAVSYCIARCYVTQLDHLRKLAIVLSVMVAILGVFAIPEAVFHIRFLQDIPAQLTGFSYDMADDTRIGLLRAATTFEHPILFGLFCATLFTFAWYMTASTAGRMIHLAMTVLATFLSLSSAAVLILVLQIGLVVCERLTRRFPKRLLVISLMLICAITFVELMSNRGVIKLIGTYLTFNPHTAYYRVLQWDHAIDDVLQNPLFGINLADWTKPHWMTGSVDNHWLLLGMNSGLPAVFALWAVLAVIGVKLYRKKRRTVGRVLQRACLAWLIAAMSLFLGAWTVALFGKMLPIFMFFIGIGAAMTRLSEGEVVDDTPVSEPVLRIIPVYTRFKRSQGPDQIAQQSPIQPDPDGHNRADRRQRHHPFKDQWPV